MISKTATVQQLKRWIKSRETILRKKITTISETKKKSERSKNLIYSHFLSSSPTLNQTLPKSEKEEGRRTEKQKPKLTMVAVAELWQTLSHAIHAYTGLSPAAFFTAIAVAAAIYHLVASFLAPAPPAPRSRETYPESEPLPPPVQLGEVTEEELKTYDGSDPKKPLLMAIKGQIYDVTQSRSIALCAECLNC
jgi:hypothetical protein